MLQETFANEKKFSGNAIIFLLTELSLLIPTYLDEISFVLRENPIVFKNFGTNKQKREMTGYIYLLFKKKNKFVY